MPLDPDTYITSVCVNCERTTYQSYLVPAPELCDGCWLAAGFPMEFPQAEPQEDLPNDTV